MYSVGRILEIGGIHLNIAISGGTGFVGKSLTKLLQDNGHQIFILTRNKSSYENSIHYVQWLTEGARPELELDNIDAIINLAGTSLNNGRWTKKTKESHIYEPNGCYARNCPYNGGASEETYCTRKCQCSRNIPTFYQRMLFREL